MDEPLKLMTLLKRHRLAKGLTQAELGKKVDRSASSVCEWESGASIPEAEVFPKLARVLGIDPMVLTNVIEPTASQQAAQ